MSEQMSLGGAIDHLASLDPGAEVKTAAGSGIVGVDSYRGYYECLALEPGGTSTVADLLGWLEKAVGATFTGYKGGEYLMRRSTPLFVAHYGCTGAMLTGFSGEGPVEILTEEESW